MLGETEILDDSGSVKEIIPLVADAQIWGLVEYDFIIPVSEMQILANHIADSNEKNLFVYMNRKLDSYIAKLEEKGSIILKKHILIEKNEKFISFRAKIYAREQIGIKIPAEEFRENELE